MYSGYTNDEALNNKREEHQKYIQRGNIIKWMYEAFKERRDLYGYFEDPKSIVEMLNQLIEEAVAKELYEIAEELKYFEEDYRCIDCRRIKQLEKKIKLKYVH